MCRENISHYLLTILALLLLVCSRHNAESKDFKLELAREIKDLKKTVGSISSSISLSGALDCERLAYLLLEKQSQRRDSGLFLRREAIELFSKAALLYPDDSSLQFRTNLQVGRIYSEIGFEDEAVKSFDKASEFANGPIEEAFIIYHQGKSLGEYGHHEQAIALLRKTLDIIPSFMEAYLPLVESYRAQDSLTKSQWKDLMTEIEQKMKKSSALEIEMNADSKGLLTRYVTSSKQEHTDVFWGQFLIADKLDRFDIAWDFANGTHIMTSNRLKEHYSQESAMSQTQTITKVFKKGFWPDPSRHIGSESTFPVFIVGMPRSGASVLEAMLASHKEMYGTGDGSVFGDLYEEVRDEVVQDWGSPVSLLRTQNIVKSVTDRLIEGMESVLKNDTSVSEKKRPHVRHMVEKPLASFRTLAIIHYLFPKALIINMMRDPLDTIFSCITNRIIDQETTIWQVDISHTVHEYIQYLQVTDHYRNVLPDVFIDVSYEALVTAPEATLTPILKRLGLEWDPNMLDFHKQKRNVKLHSRQQLRKKLNDDSIGSWRRYPYHMTPIIIYLKKILPVARDRNLVAFKDTMNWEVDEYFEYPKIKKEKIDKLIERESNNEMDIKKEKMNHKEKEKKKKSKGKKKKGKKKKKKKKKKGKKSKKITTKKKKKNKINKNTSQLNNKISVAFIIPTTSFGLEEDAEVSSLPLFRLLVPTLRDTLTDEKDWANMTLYLGYDEDDVMYDNQQNLKELHEIFQLNVPDIQLNPLRMVGMKDKVAHIWNSLMYAAYEDEAEYFCVLSDDANLLQKGWLKSLITTLQTKTLVPNFGTVAFYEEHKKLKHGTFPTFPTLHRTHLEIFGKDYAVHPFFSNSYSDPYLADIYKPFQSAKIAINARIKNVIGGEDLPRYNPGPPVALSYVELVIWGRKRISKWLAKNHPHIVDTWSVTNFQYGSEGLLYDRFCVDEFNDGCMAKYVKQDSVNGEL